MSKFAKVNRTEWLEIGNMLCAVFIGKNSLQKDVSVAVPAGALQTLAAEARRRLLAIELKGRKQVSLEEWAEQRFLSYRTINTGTTDENKVGIVFDRGLETEFALSLSQEHARDLAGQLLRNVDQKSNISQTMN